MGEIILAKMPFRGVALALIIFGALVIGVCGAAWILAYFWDYFVISMPFTKLIGGFIVVALGYVVLELELMRCNK